MIAKKANKKAAPKSDNKEVATSNTMPEFLKGMGNRGSEDVDQNDLVIPRIEVVQSLSKVRKKASSQFIEGADEGMLYNSVTRELYGTQVVIVPVAFVKEYLVWREQVLGGGFGGAYHTEQEAQIEIASFEAPKEWEAVLTHQHFCLLVKEDFTSEEVVISMSKSKLKISRKFNSLVRINGGDRFSRVYRLLGVEDANQQGQEFFNLDICNIGFVTESLYRHAEKVYEMIRSGAASADRSFDNDFEDEAGKEGQKEY